MDGWIEKWAREGRLLQSYSPTDCMRDATAHDQQSAPTADANGWTVRNLATLFSYPNLRIRASGASAERSGERKWRADRHSLPLQQLLFTYSAKSRPGLPSLPLHFYRQISPRVDLLLISMFIAAHRETAHARKEERESCGPARRPRSVRDGELAGPTNILRRVGERETERDGRPSRQPCPSIR